MVFKGTTSGSIYSSEMQAATKIKSYSIVNKTGSSVSVSVVVVEPGVEETYINSVSIDDSLQYSTNIELVLLKGFIIHIITSGQVDFYFTIE